MSKQDFTPYQQKIIKRYYDNEGGVKEQRLAELPQPIFELAIRVTTAE